MRILGVLLLLLGVFSVCWSATPQSEINALRDLFYWTNGQNWKAKDNWLVGDPCQNNWYGIACIENQGVSHIDGLFLSGNNLSSKNGLPNSIGALQFLTGLDMGHNNLYGQIPAGFRQLRLLSGLSFRENFLSGNLTNLPASGELRWIHLDFNAFSGCFDCHKDLFDAMSNVVVLGLTDNKLSGQIPAGIGNKWKSIKTLLLGGNQLSGGIPLSLLSFTPVEQLDLSRNMFDRFIDDRVANKTHAKLEFSENLIELNLFSNPLSGEFCHRQDQKGKVVVFDAHNTRMFGNFPNFFFPQANFPFLRYLKVGDSELSGFLSKTILSRTDVPVIELNNIPLMCPLQDWVQNQLVPSRKSTIGNVDCLYLSISKLTPDHGNKKGGFPILISGKNLPRAVTGELQAEFRYKTTIKRAPITNIDYPYTMTVSAVPDFTEFAEDPIQVGVSIVYKRSDDGAFVQISRETLQLVLSNFGARNIQNSARIIEIQEKPAKIQRKQIHNSNKPGVFAVKKSAASPVQVAIFGEQKCPDFGSIVTIFNPIMRSGLANIIDLEVGYIARYSEQYATNFWSLHGQGEVIGNKFGLCAMNYLKYPIQEVLQFLTCLNKNISSIPLNVADCAQKSSFDMKSLESCVYSSIGTQLLKDSASHADAMGAVWSPTIYMNGELYCLWDSMPCKASKPSDFVKDICALYKGQKPVECDNPEDVFRPKKF